jgi:hypothetical protein
MVRPCLCALQEQRQPNPTSAHALTQPERRVRLAAFRGDLNVGDVIEIQYRHERTTFRVGWIRAPENSADKHIGAECLDPDKNTWRVKFAARPDAYEEKNDR